MNTSPIRSLGASILATLFLAPLAPAQKVTDLHAAKEADRVVFVVSISRPQDCGTLAVEPGGNFGWWVTPDAGQVPRMPSLTSSPAWTVGAYPEFPSPFGDEPVGDEPALQGALDPLVFIGSAPAGSASIDLTLRYPTGEHDWATSPIHLDLAAAPPPAPDPNPGSDPKRLARAQAQWFRFLTRQSPDTGGFYAFAEQQTLRRAGLPTRAPDAGNGTWDDPSNETYALASGALAIQESLQLDRMTNPAATLAPATIPLADIKPVEIASHPYDQMRAGAAPMDTPMARLVPADNWFVRFGDLSKLLDLADYGDRWGTSLLRLSTATGQDFGVRERLLTQLCLTDGPVVRALGPSVVGEVAFTGSDGYVRLGSDVTALFAVKNRPLFVAAMEPVIQQALAAGAARDSISVGRFTVERIRTPDGRISCHRAWIRETCIYSNSESAIARVLSAGDGNRPSLADAPDYQYVRATVFPFAPNVVEPKEDGLVYLSDAFVRRAVSPKVRIAQLRRLQALASLKMIENSAMLYGWDRGPSRPAMVDLLQTQYLTASDLIDPTGGSYNLDAQSGIASSPYWGTMRHMRPLVEVTVEAATEAERDAYDAFRNQYQSYWQRFMDPVAIRIGVGPTITLETHILPLIDLSQYEQMKDFAGGPPVEVSPARFTDGTLLRFVSRLGEGQTRRSIVSWMGAYSGTNAASDWLGDWVTFWVEDSETLARIVAASYDDRADNDPTFDIFRASIVAGVNVKNRLSLATFLVGLRAVIDQVAPDTVIYETLEPYSGTTIVKVSPNPAGDLARNLQDQAAEGEQLQPLVPALYYATIGDGWYLATQEASLKRLIDRTGADANTATPPAEAPTAPLPTDHANLYLYASPSAATGIRPVISAILERQAMKASLANLAQVELLGRCGLLEGRDQSVAAQTYLGYRLVDPDGGSYSYEPATDLARSTLHGTRIAPTALPAPPPGSPLAGLLDQLKTLSAALRFTEDGLETTVRIRRE